MSSNYFAVLEATEEEEPSILRPSVLDKSAHSAAAASHDAATTARSSSTHLSLLGGSSTIDLASVAAELGHTTAAGNGVASATSWDFSSLHTIANDHEQMFQKELTDKQVAYEAHLVAMHEADAALRDKVRRSAAVSRKDRLRAEMATNVRDRLASKQSRKAAAVRRRNKIKST
jgi:hypothetical protein